jgi:predicted ATPase with chaperone activity
MHIDRYTSRVRGPLLDRIDMLIEVPARPYPRLLLRAEVRLTCVSSRQGVKRGGQID